MKILILSCNTGAGHNSAAAAIKEYLDSRSILSEIKDALAFDSRVKSEVISRGHVLIYKKAPSLFGAGYQYAEHHPSKPGSESVIYGIMKRGADALYLYLCENEFDAVICTHVFASMMLTEIQKTHGLAMKTYFVATDYTCTPGVDEITADAYFIPHPHLIAEFTNNGIPEEKLIPSGIPVKRAFYRSLPAEKAKQMLDFPQDKKMILLMCGSMGCGPIVKLAKRILNTMPEDAVLTVICGNNERLQKQFRKLDSEDKLCVVGFTNKINLYMDSAAVMLTKPGGLSSTEAATKALPMVFMNVVAGCETRNLDFFMKNGYAVSAETVEALAELTVSLLCDTERALKMSKALEASFSAYAAQLIGDHVLSNI